MDRGDLVPDAVILGIIKAALAEPRHANGVLLDGVVRTVPQAEGLATVTAELGRQVDVPLPTTAVTNEMLTAARGMGLAEKDFAILFEALARMAGVSN